MKPAEIVAQRLIDLINKGVSPWARPWRTTGQSAPRNGISGRKYNGMNFFVLASMAYSSPNWFTYKSATALGAQVKKGEKGTPVAYWMIPDKDKKTGKKLTPEQKKKIRPFLLYYTVFNEAQIDNLPEKYIFKPLVVDDTETKGEKITAAEQAIKDWATQVPHKFGGERAFYSPFEDRIQMPKRETFKEWDGYYHVFFHEMAHSTGSKKRLDRDLSGHFGGKTYAQEELVAELTASLFGEHFNFDVKGNDAAYLQSWVKGLTDENGNFATEIFRAASKAQKAFNLIIGKEDKDATEELSEKEE